MFVFLKTSLSAATKEMLTDYYANPHVRARMLEFLGGESLEDTTSLYITADDSSPDVKFASRPVGDLWQCLDEGLDIGRSMWDRNSLIAHLDIEYVNFDFPGEPYLEPARTFDLQRPVVVVVQEMLLGCSISFEFCWQWVGTRVISPD